MEKTLEVIAIALFANGATKDEIRAVLINLGVSETTDIQSIVEAGAEAQGRGEMGHMKSSQFLGNKPYS